jgi:CheY-like chemotaxis protein
VPQTLLLADDSTTIQRVIELTFADEDIQVVSVSDGDQAIARLESAPPDIVLADIGMPGKNGYEVAEYIKQSPKLAHIPVVLLTGAFEPVDQEKAAAIGCDAVLAKPFEPQIVIGRVRELLGRSASASGNELATARLASADGNAPATAEDLPLAAPPADAVAEPAPAPRVEDYFDRLDAAFATLSNQPASAPVAAAAPVAVEAPQDFAVADQLAAEPPTVPESPAPRLVAKPLEPVEPPEPRNPPGALPSIADAFRAILAAEQNALGVRPEWPTPSSQPASAAAGGGTNSEIIITDDLIDRVARRVLEQLSDQVVRETVASIASDVAERLVREEIERIKASIK